MKTTPAAKYSGLVALGDAFCSAFRNIWANRVRNFSMLIGLILGITAIVGTLGVIQAEQPSNAASPLTPECITLTFTDVKHAKQADIANFNGITEVVVPYMERASKVKYQTVVTDVTLIGTSEEYSDIANVELKAGRMLTQDDIEKKRRVVMIGVSATEELFGDEDPLGRELRIGSDVFSVIGVADVSDDLAASRIVILPYSVGRVHFAGSDVTQYVLKAKSVRKLPKAEEALRNYLTEKELAEEEYQIKRESQTEPISPVYLLIIGLAVIAALVSGIEIMKAMLRLASERSSEIALRRAIGASKVDIMSRFLLEGMLLSSIAGILGIIAGTVLTCIIGGVMCAWVFPNPLMLIAVLAIAILFGGIFSLAAAISAIRIYYCE